MGRSPTEEYFYIRFITLAVYRICKFFEKGVKAYDELHQLWIDDNGIENINPFS